MLRCLLGAVLAMSLVAGAGAQVEFVFEATSKGESSYLVKRDGETFAKLDEWLLSRRVRGILLLQSFNKVYATSQKNDIHMLVSIDSDTGELADIGATGIAGEPESVCLATNPVSGVHYLSTQSDLYTLDLDTGAATNVGHYGFQPVDRMYAFAINDAGEAYGIDFGLVDGKANLNRIDLATAGLTNLGDLGFSPSYYSAMAFRSDGKLFGARTNGGDVWEINIGAVTDKFVATGEGDYPDGWDFAIEGGGSCYADCDNDGSVTLFDFLCFVNAFNDADPFADCLADGALDIFDFLCFTNEFNECQ